MNTQIKKIAITSAFAVTSLLASAGLIHAQVFTQLTNQMGVGSTGSSVTNLQTFLGSDANFYTGNVNGYYGPLTEAAVKQFQLAYEIPMIGNVGPVTLGQVNTTMARGYGIDVYAASIYNVSVQPTYNSATINWNTTKSANGIVFYSTSPFFLTEAVGSFTAPSILGGLSVIAPYSQLNQNVVISNLQTHTTYYYIIQTTEGSNNTSVTNTSTFTTN